MKPYTLTQRAEFYAVEFPQWPASHPVVVNQNGRDWFFAVWTLGNDYRNRSRLYGAYPPNYLRRVMSMYPDAEDILHLFSGSLPAGPYTRMDLMQPADVQANAEELTQHFQPGQFDLCVADPPYTKEDAKRYKCKMVNRKKVLHGLYDVIRPGGHVIWLDTTYTMFRKTQFHVAGFITLVRGTNHRFRVVTIYVRV